jgi:hypothetical protein
MGANVGADALRTLGINEHAPSLSGSIPALAPMGSNTQGRPRPTSAPLSESRGGARDAGSGSKLCRVRLETSPAPSRSPGCAAWWRHTGVYMTHPAWESGGGDFSNDSDNDPSYRCARFAEATGSPHGTSASRPSQQRGRQRPGSSFCLDAALRPRVLRRIAGLLVFVRCDARLESTVGSPNPVADGPRTRATSPSCAAASRRSASRPPTRSTSPSSARATRRGKA